MNTSDGFIRNLFRSTRPELNHADFTNAEVWVCDLLNQDQDLAHEYIRFRLDKEQSNDNRLSFLYECRHCFNYALAEINLSLESPDFAWHLTCCGAPNFEDVKQMQQKYERALNHVDLAICHYQDSEKLACSETKQNKCNPEHTTARQVMTIYYLAEHLGIWGVVDKAKVELFTEFLTGKNGSEIHKKFKNPLDNKESKMEQVKDLKFVRDQFEKLGLRDIVDKINRDMQ